MALVNNGRKRPKIRKAYESPAKVEVIDEVINFDEEATATEKAEEIVEETVVVEAVEEPAEEIVEEVAEESAEEVVEEAVEEAEIIEEVIEEAIEETAELEEVPLEASEEEMEATLEEEGSLDGTAEEVEALAEETHEEVAEEPVEVVEEAHEEVAEEPVEVVEEAHEEVAEEPVEVVEEAHEEVAEEPVEVVEEAHEEVAEEPAEVVEEAHEEVAEEPVEVVEEAHEEVAEEPDEAVEESEEEPEEEEKPSEDKPKKEEFKLTAPANLADLLANMCTKRARKLIYRPNDVIFSHTTTVLGTDKNNDEKIKIKSILDAEIKQGVKLGYLDKFDGLKMSELKEEYENDIVYEYAEQEFKRTGILLDGDKVKVYIYDWDMKACHHVGYIDDESAELVKPYILERDKYSFDIDGIIVGGKYKKVIKDEKTGKITVEKGNDGNLGMEIDINIINRKD